MDFTVWHFKFLSSGQAPTEIKRNWDLKAGWGFKGGWGFLKKGGGLIKRAGGGDLKGG